MANGYYPPQTWYFPPGGYQRINIPPVTPYPPDPYINQFPYAEALAKGTLFRWLYHPYEEPKQK